MYTFWSTAATTGGSRDLRGGPPARRHGQGAHRGRFRLRDYLRLSDLFCYGMMPQFISRFGSIAIFEELGREELKKIMLSATIPAAGLAGLFPAWA